MLHCTICWRRENSRNVQGIQVRVLLMLMQCLLQSNSNYPFRGYKEFGVLHCLYYSLRVWEPHESSIFTEELGGDQQYTFLHVSKMVSLGAKVVLSNGNYFHCLVPWEPDSHRLFLVYKRKKQMISRIDQQWPKSVLGQITLTQLDNHNRPLGTGWTPLNWTCATSTRTVFYRW